MKIDDRPGSCLFFYQVEHLFGRHMRIIVLGKDVPVDKAISFLMQGDTLTKRRFAVRRTEERCLSRPFGYVSHILTKRRAPTLEVVVGVVTDGVTSLDHLLKDLRVLVDVLAHHKERRLDLIPIQDLQHFRRHLGDRTVVKSEVHVCTRTKNSVRVQTLPYRFEIFQI